jgi:hypothetical protein
MTSYLVRPWEETKTFPCADCGAAATRVAGDVLADGTVRAVYRMTWVESHPERRAHLAIGLGSWDQRASRADRHLIELQVWHRDRYPSLTVIDSPSHREFVDNVLGIGLRRDQVVGTPVGRELFEITDQVMFHDPRVLAFLRTDRWPA